jgi:NAD-dependent DNA ligase
MSYLPLIDSLGRHVLTHLYRNPTVHELAEAHQLSLREARQIQKAYAEIWQALYKNLRKRKADQAAGACRSSRTP